MKKKVPAIANSTRENSNVTDWIRELWEVEAQHTAMVGSRLKFGLPLVPEKPRRRKAKAAKGRKSAAKK